LVKSADRGVAVADLAGCPAPSSDGVALTASVAPATSAMRLIKYGMSSFFR
jgi:hypothetical protein